MQKKRSDDAPDNPAHIISLEGFDFIFDPGACRQCSGRCCRGRSGSIWLTLEDVKRIALFLNISQTDLLCNHLHKKNGRLSINEVTVGTEYHCAFFNGTEMNCSIYPVRPHQCRQFPFWEYYRIDPRPLAFECPGVIFSKTYGGRAK